MSLRDWRVKPALLAMFTGWAALFSWSGMVAQPLGFLLLVVAIGLVLALGGSLLRLLPLPWYAVAGAQALVIMLALNLIYASEESTLGLVPTASSVREVVYVLANGGATLNTYAAPVTINPTHTQALLAACGLLVLLAVDVLAEGLRRPTLVALPLLVTLSVPVSILNGALALPVFVVTALLFLRLLAVERIDGWTSGPGTRSEAAPAAAHPGAASMWVASVGAVLLALLLAPAVPVADLLDRHDEGTGDGAGSGYQLTAVNPLIRLRRDLVEQTNTPLVYAETDSPSTGYLRTTVLDLFTGDEWRPSRRILPSDNAADGTFPSPPGLAVDAPGVTADWSLELAPAFSTTWLPLPYPIRTLDVPGGWRFDTRTLDVALVGRASSDGLEYDATSFTPSINARQLDSALRAPTRVRSSMTMLPDDVPEVIEQRAREVTAGAKSDFAKTVALQNWFRRDGGFTYSLEPRPGSGMDLLADFVTDDRVGYCEQFAAAMATMARSLDIPSRVVVGFLDGQVQSDGRILYTSDDRHAWPEMYFTGVGWVRFEPTPGQRAGATPAYTRQDVTAPVPTDGPSSQPSAAPRADRDATDADSASDDSGAPVPWWPVAALVVVLLVAIVPVLLRGVQRRRRLAATTPVHLAEGAWAELRATALDLGLTWPERGSPREQARSVVDQVLEPPAEEVGSLEGLLVQVERGRYARAEIVRTIDAQERARTLETVETWRRRMIGSVDRERSWRSRMWPVSLVRRRP